MDRNMYTDSTSRNGLGLFICRGLVQALGGEISVDSEVGRYAEFTVRLPYREVTDGDVGAEAVQKPASIAPTLPRAGGVKNPSCWSWTTTRTSYG